LSTKIQNIFGLLKKLFTFVTHWFKRLSVFRR